MDATKLHQLREMAENTNVEVDRALVLELIASHEAQQRAESFWSGRAPAMNDELVAIREVETHTRATVRILSMIGAPLESLEAALGELAALRAKQAAA